MSIPKDPVMLMSYLNTQLRDNYESLDSLCSNLNIDKEMILKTLEAIDYHYVPEQNQFK